MQFEMSVTCYGRECGKVAGKGSISNNLFEGTGLITRKHAVTQLKLSVLLLFLCQINRKDLNAQHNFVLNGPKSSVT